MNLDKSYFCIKPFVHTTVTTDGTYELCCQSMCKLSKFNGKKNFNFKTDSYEEWFNSDYMNYVRDKMLKNEKLEECNDCWIDESNGFKSIRQRSNEDYGLYIFKKLPEQLQNLKINNLTNPIDWELQLTNLCNLSCNTCISKSSSKLLNENKKLFAENFNQKDYDLNEFAYKQLEQIFSLKNKIITLRGGEPFIIPDVGKILLQSIQNNTAKEIDLHITTNGTHLPEDILKLLPNFKKVKIMLSIDAIENYNSYIRYPSKWNDITNNYNKLKQLDNCEILINCTISNMNILYISDLIKWCDDNNLWLQWEMVKEPFYFRTENLPKDLKQMALDRILDVEIIKGKSLKILKTFLKNIIDVEYDINMWNKFMHITNARDKFRKTNIKESLPEIGHYF